MQTTCLWLSQDLHLSPSGTETHIFPLQCSLLPKNSQLIIWPGQVERKMEKKLFFAGGQNLCELGLLLLLLWMHYNRKILF